MQQYIKGHVTLRGTLHLPCQLEVNPALLYPHNDSVNGVVLDNHITLLYGLFPTSTINWQEEVNVLMKTLIPPKIQLKAHDLVVFNIDKYVAAIVLKTENASLIKMNNVLRTNLPHVDDKYEFKPHITLFYVHRGAENQIVEYLRQQLRLINENMTFIPTYARVKEPSW